MPDVAEEIHTHKSLADLEASLSRRERKIALLVEQVQRERSNYEEEIKAKLKADFEKLEKVKAELGPKIALYEKTRSEAETNLSALSKLQEQINKQQEVLNRTAKDSENEQAMFNKAKAEFIAFQKAESVRLENEKNYAIGAMERARQQQETLDKRTTEEDARLRERESKIRENLKESERIKAEAVSFLDEAKKKELTISGQIVSQTKVIQESEKRLDLEAQELSKREQLLKGREKAAHVMEQTNKDEAERLDKLSKGLSKAKVDIEIAEGKIRKRELLVNSLIEKHGLSNELSKMEPKD